MNVLSKHTQNTCGTFRMEVKSARSVLRTQGILGNGISTGIVEIVVNGEQSKDRKIGGVIVGSPVGQRRTLPYHDTSTVKPRF